MNDKQLKWGLLQLVHEGWFTAKVTDELVESLLDLPDEPPSGDLREQFLLRFRTRIEDALQHRPGKPGELDYAPSVEFGGSQPDRGAAEDGNLKRRKYGR
jgi:hypothetical protein